MTIGGIVDQFIASQNIGLLNTIVERLILNRCPLNGYFKLILATAVSNPLKEADEGEVNNDHNEDKSYLAKNDDVIENSIDRVIEKSYVYGERNRVSCKYASCVTPN